MMNDILALQWSKDRGSSDVSINVLGPQYPDEVVAATWSFLLVIYVSLLITSAGLVIFKFKVSLNVAY